VLLAQLHGQLAVRTPSFEAASQQKALDWLDARHRITPAVVARFRAKVESWDTRSVISVPTHGDWQPRNWLIERSEGSEGSNSTSSGRTATSSGRSLCRDGRAGREGVADGATRLRWDVAWKNVLASDDYTLELLAAHEPRFG